MSTSGDLERWRRDWRAASPDTDTTRFASALRTRVARQSRRLMIGLIAPLLVTVVVGGGLIMHAVIVREPVAIAAAIEGWLFILVTWVGSFWVGRGTWRPSGETTSAFLDLSIRRCRANLKAVSLAIALYLCQIVIIVLLTVSYSDMGLGAALTSWPMLVIGGVGLPAFLLVGFVFTRRQRAQLEQLLDLRRQLDTG